MWLDIRASRGCDGDKFVPVIGPGDMGRDIVSTLTEDRHGNLWVAGNFGLWMRSREGKLRLYQTKDGLPENFVRSVWEDRDGNLWAGTNGGLARLENGRFVSNPLANSAERDWVRCIYEDAQGNLWVGMNSGLNRLRDDMFAIYGESEGLPSDEPTTVYQDHARPNLDRFSRPRLGRSSAARNRASTPLATACPATRFFPSGRTIAATC